MRQAWQFMKKTFDHFVSKRRKVTCLKIKVSKGFVH